MISHAFRLVVRGALSVFGVNVVRLGPTTVVVARGSSAGFLVTFGFFSRLTDRAVTSAYHGMEYRRCAVVPIAWVAVWLRHGQARRSERLRFRYTLCSCSVPSTQLYGATWHQGHVAYTLSPRGPTHDTTLPDRTLHAPIVSVLVCALPTVVFPPVCPLYNDRIWSSGTLPAPSAARPGGRRRLRSVHARLSRPCAPCRSPARALCAALLTG